MMYPPVGPSSLPTPPVNPAKTLDGQIGKRIKEDLLSALSEKYPATNVRANFKSKSQVIIFGTGIIIERIFLMLKAVAMRGDCKILAYTDNDKNKWGKIYYEHEVLPPKEAVKKDADYYVLATEWYIAPMRETLLKLGIDEEKIIYFDEFIVRTLYGKGGAA